MGIGNQESAHEHVAGTVLSEPAIGDECGERGLESRVPDLAALAECGRRERRGRGLEVLEDALVDGEVMRDGVP